MLLAEAEQTNLLVSNALIAKSDNSDYLIALLLTYVVAAMVLRTMRYGADTSWRMTSTIIAFRDCIKAINLVSLTTALKLIPVWGINSLKFNIQQALVTL